MNDFLSPAWRGVLAENRLDDFESLWSVDAPWFETPNRRRGGWSGVTRHEFTTADGKTCCAFLKRQENHRMFSWRHPLLGIPTFLKEYQLIRRYRAGGIPTVEPIYFAMRRGPAGHRAILMTAALDGFVPLKTCMDEWKRTGKPPFAERHALLAAVAQLTRSIHRCRIQHNCYYPKHIFVKKSDATGFEARVIDLEKSRWRPFRLLCTLRDLDTLNRHSGIWSLRDRLRFLKDYLDIDKLSPYAKWLWHRLAARSRADRDPASIAT